MDKLTGFIKFHREQPQRQSVKDRLKHYKEFVRDGSPSLVREQSARCMDCGIPFCHSSCPLGNIIPEFNDAVYQEKWEDALHILSKTNNFPEFTGRICPAPCETGCVLGINDDPVSIEFIEKTIVEKGFELGLIKPQPPLVRTGKKVAVVGSGPAGLACADQLNKAGHSVSVYERARQLGGLLRYGIPDFKLEKSVVQRRINLLAEEGITFHTSVGIGMDITMNELEKIFDAIVLCIGSTVPRNLPIEGRSLKGIHFAMDFLSQQNSRNAMDANWGHLGKPVDEIKATGKHVVVIGGGDTGSDCVGTSNRQGALSVIQIEFLPIPPEKRSEKTPWPEWPIMLRTSSSYEEGVDRRWSLLTKKFGSNDNGCVSALHLVEVEWSSTSDATSPWKEKPGSDFELPCDLVLLAIGFMHPQQKGIIEANQLRVDSRNNIDADEKYQTSKPGIFVAGDARRGQSLVVWAISEGRECAFHVDSFLRGEASHLPQKDVGMLALG